MAIGSFTLTPSVPSVTRILPSTPSSTASTSIVALSVSISAITSPARTFSPSFLSQRDRVPSVIVGDSAGIRMLVAMSCSPSDDLLHGVDHPFGLRQRGFFQIGGVGQRHIEPVHAHRRRVQPVECVLDYLHPDLRADAREWPAFLHRYEAGGLLHAFHNGGGVEWTQRAKVYHLRLDALFSKRLGCLHRHADHDAERDDRHMLADAFD